MVEVVEKGLFFHKLSTSVNMRESDQTEGRLSASASAETEGRTERLESRSFSENSVFLERQKLLLAR